MAAASNFRQQTQKKTRAIIHLPLLFSSFPDKLLFFADSHPFPCNQFWPRKWLHCCASNNAHHPLPRKRRKMQKRSGLPRNWKHLNPSPLQKRLALACIIIIIFLCLLHSRLSICIFTNPHVFILCLYQRPTAALPTTLKTAPCTVWRGRSWEARCVLAATRAFGSSARAAPRAPGRHRGSTSGMRRCRFAKVRAQSTVAVD